MRRQKDSDKAFAADHVRGRLAGAPAFAGARPRPRAVIRAEAARVDRVLAAETPAKGFPCQFAVAPRRAG